MKVLIAGGAGCLGSCVTKLLLDEGHEVVVVDNLLSGERKNLAHVIDKLTFIEADICRKEDYLPTVGDIDAIIHLAFPTSLCTRELDRQFHHIASVGTANLLELAVTRNAYFIYGSSVSVYGIQKYLPVDEEHPANPILLYGANKLHGENLCRIFGSTYGLKYVVLRYSDFYGPRDKRASAINSFLKAALGNDCIEISGGGEQVRSYTYVRDAAAATLMTLKKQPVGEIFNVSTAESISINELAEKVKTMFGPELRIKRSSDPVDTRRYIFDNSKFTKFVGPVEWTSLETGLGETFSYLRAEHSAPQSI